MSATGERTWDAMLDAFRRLGGVAENIRVEGSGGLCAIEARDPVMLLVPPNLCFPVGDLEFRQGGMRLKDSADFGPDERRFFEAWQTAFFRAALGTAQALAFSAIFDNLPPDVRSLLTDEFGMADVFADDPAARATARLLKNSAIQWAGRDRLIPVACHANRGGQGLIGETDASGRFQIRGKVQGEILISRGVLDTFGTFCNFGTVAPQPVAYSLPIRVKTSSGDLIIEQNCSENVRRGEFPTPRIASTENGVVFSYLMIGSPNRPRLSRGIFLALAREAAISRPDEAFDFILFANRTKFLKLLGVLEPHDGDAVVALRRATHVQLERISHCIGTREL